MQFEINVRLCKNAVYDISHYKKALNTQCEELKSVYHTLRNHQDTAMREIAKKVFREIQSLEKDIVCLNALQTGLEKICLYYEMNEKTIEDLFDEAKAPHWKSITALPQAAVMLKGLSGIKSRFR